MGGIFLEETENFLRLLISERKKGNEMSFCINYLASKESHDGVFDDLTSDNETIPAGIYRFLWGGSNKDVDVRVDLVENSITSLQQNVAALDIPALTALAGSVIENTNAIEGKADSSTVSTLATRVTTAEGEIDQLQTDIAVKADSSTVTTLAGRVTTAEGEIDQLQTGVAGKADSSTVSTLAGRVTTAEGGISTLQTTVAGKADSSTVTTLAGRVTTAEGEIDQLQTDVAGKADQSSVDTNTANIATNTASINALGTQFYHMSFHVCASDDKIVDNTKMDDAFFDDIDALVSSTSTGGKSGKGGSSSSSENIEETCMAYLLCYINQLEGRESYLADDSQYTCPTFDTTCGGLTSVSNVCSMNNSPFESLCGVSSNWFVERVAEEICSGIS